MNQSNQTRLQLAYVNFKNLALKRDIQVGSLSLSVIEITKFVSGISPTLNLVQFWPVESDRINFQCLSSKVYFWVSYNNIHVQLKLITLYQVFLPATCSLPTRRSSCQLFLSSLCQHFKDFQEIKALFIPLSLHNKYLTKNNNVCLFTNIHLQVLRRYNKL